jgi:2-polyprenyl-6-hydroxyphenyl methylase/3-demethylubiquinone-9 3-methyltransferase
VGAEYLLKLIEPGTHDWNKFLTPKELEELLSKVGLKISSVSGMDYNPITYPQ